MKNVVEYKTARTTEYALLTQPIINDNRNRREEKPEVQMGGAGPAVGRLSPEPGRSFLTLYEFFFFKRILVI